MTKFNEYLREITKTDFHYKSYIIYPPDKLDDSDISMYNVFEIIILKNLSKTSRPNAYKVTRFHLTEFLACSDSF